MVDVQTNNSQVLRLNMKQASLMYPANQIVKNNLISTSGAVSDMKVSGESLTSKGPSIEVIVSQNNTRYVSSDFGVLLPLQPFNNRIIVSFEAQAFVNTNSSRSIKNSTAELANYYLVCKMYLRKKTYPFTIYSKYPDAKIILTNNSRVYSEGLDLDPEYA